MEIIVIKELITKDHLKEIASKGFGDLVKAVVDIDKRIAAIGGEMHADEEEVLLNQGSKQENLWGINLYPDLEESEWLEFDSMINVRPRQNNRSRSVESEETQKVIIEIIGELIK